MMYAWSFSARTVDEVTKLVRALSKHRYVREADLRLHFTVDLALANRPAFAERARAFRERAKSEKEYVLASRDPSLWRGALLAEVIEALTVFWSPDDEGARARENLAREVEKLALPKLEHAPFHADVESPPHPELVLLDWVLLPIDELDTELHRGALDAMEDSGEEVDTSKEVHQEGPILALPELVHGAANGVLREDFFVWSEPPYAYADYVFRGAAKAAKLVDPPTGYEDI